MTISVRTMRDPVWSNECLNLAHTYCCTSMEEESNTPRTLPRYEIVISNLGDYLHSQSPKRGWYIYLLLQFLLCFYFLLYTMMTIQEEAFYDSEGSHSIGELLIL